MLERKITWKEKFKKYTSFDKQKSQSYIWGNIYFGIIVFTCLSSTKPCLRFFVICFAWKLKGVYQSSLENEVDIMNVSPNALAKNQNLKKLRHSFVDERPAITTTLISSCYCKTRVLLCLQKKRPEITFLTLTVIYL